MQIPHTHTLHPCPNLPLSLVLHRQTDSHAETFSPALRVLSARCLSLSNQRKPNRTHCDDSGKGLEAHCFSKKQVCTVSLHWTHGLMHPGQSLRAPLTIFTLLVFNELNINTSPSQPKERKGKARRDGDSNPGNRYTCIIWHAGLHSNSLPAGMYQIPPKIYPRCTQRHTITIILLRISRE